MILAAIGPPIENGFYYDFAREEPFTDADLETIEAAVRAAETGHLVFSTLHTSSAPKTIDRIIDALPGELREQTKSFLSMSLKAVVTQVLVKTPDGRGRRAAAGGRFSPCPASARGDRTGGRPDA